MIKGIGIDIIELSRIERLLQKNDRFEKRVLTPEERRRMNGYDGRRKIEFAGGRFAAKEAFTKAVGTGISARFGFQEVEVTNDVSGKPCIKAAGHDGMVHVSISHSRDYAVAQVVIE